MRRYTTGAALLLVLALVLVHHHDSSISSAVAKEVNIPKVEQGYGAVPAGITTDSEVVQRESESITARTFRSGAEKFDFQAEVSRLMDIIINSLYSNKDIFLRELISNASDALDKIRFLSLTDKDVLGEGDTTKLEIRIKLDKEKKILSIRDWGIGMTKEDLVKNLGTIAKSGTSAFLEQMQKGGDLNLIGQFGVGFYSVYLVADYVEVISKHNDDNQYIWESKADGAFAVSEDTENEPLGRGTEIRLHLKEEASEFLQESKLKDLIQRYSEFINFPIYLWLDTDINVEVDADDDSGGEVLIWSSEEDEEGPDEEGPDEDVESNTEATPADDKKAKKKPRTKIVKKKTWDWQLLNDVKAIWLRNPKEISDEDYSNFFHSISKAYSQDKPLGWTHFSAEGDVEFKAILFIPSKAPHDLYENYYNSRSSLKLYVRRVFITDDFDELLPKYLSFLKGIVDSDTLPLNVSREMLQQHASLRTIRKKLVRKALDIIHRIVQEDPNEVENKEAESDESEVESKGEDDGPSVSDESEDESEDKSEGQNDPKGKYTKFWNQFGKSIKLGLIEDATNRNRLAKLLRFYSSKSLHTLTSLDQYIARMKPNQKDVYFITGSSKEQLEKSPFLEQLNKKGYEVIFFTDPIDEYMMQYLMDYEDKKFQNVSKEGLKLGKDSKLKEAKESFKDVTKWWKDLLVDENVDSVKISNRLADSPGVVVTSKYGWSANMERIMQAQTLSDTSRQTYMKGKRVLEINPRHPIIKELRDRVRLDPEDQLSKDSAKLVYQTALMESGFFLENPKEFAVQIYSNIKSSLSLSMDASVEEDNEEDDDEEESDETSNGTDKESHGAEDTPSKEDDIEDIPSKEDDMDKVTEPREEGSHYKDEL